MVKAPEELHVECREGLQSLLLVASGVQEQPGLAADLQIYHLIWLWTRPEGSCPGQAPWQVGWRGLSKGKIPAAQEIRSLPPLAPEATSWMSATVAHKG